MRSFISELRRRNVLRVAAFYAAAGWLLVQVATQVFPFFDIANSVVRVVVIAIALGFPIALVFAWIYEWTPQGLKLESEVVRDESITRQTASRLDRWIIAVLALAVIALLTDRFVLPRTAASTAPDKSAEKSIAVLPFENLSDDKTNAYFTDGIQDEILTRLAKLGALKVISRTSTEQFSAKPGNLVEIARQLGVANILEGSVQKAGDSVRVNVQLINAATDAHLWAETYDRKLDNIFGVESEVAGAIADALGAALSGSERKELTTAPTRSAAAYDSYLRGVALYRQGFRKDAFVGSARAFREAVKADAQFAQAWAMLARSDSTLIFFGDDASPQMRAETDQALAAAERLAPERFETQMARAYYIYRVQLDYDEARRRFEALQRRWPNESEVLSVLSYIANRQDRTADARKLVEQALVLDPLNLQYLKLLALDAMFTRGFDQALADIVRVQQVAPGEQESLNMRAAVFMARGELDRAASVLGELPAQASVADEVGEQVMLVKLQRRHAAAITWVQAVMERSGSDAALPDLLSARYVLADFQRLNGDRAAAAGNYRLTRKGLQELLAQQPDNYPVLELLACTEAGLGNAVAALELFDRLAQMEPESKDAQHARGTLELRARALAMLGRKDEAIAVIQHLLSVSYGGIASVPLTPALLRLDPDWDPLRDDPRFRKLTGA